jgi:hypothetical protein
LGEFSVVLEVLFCVAWSFSGSVVDGLCLGEWMGELVVGLSFVVSFGLGW